MRTHLNFFKNLLLLPLRPIKCYWSPWSAAKSFLGSGNSIMSTLTGGLLGIGSGNSNRPVGTDIWDTFMNGDTNYYNSENVKATNEANLKAVRETNETNKAIAEQNLGFQRENLDYQKALQQKIFEREDSAYARTAKDMRSSGLSPLMMNGTNGAGEAIQTEALNNGYQEQPFQAQAFQAQSSSPMEAISSVLSGVSQISGLWQASEKNKADIDLAKAEKANIESETNFNNASMIARLAGLDLGNKESSARYNSIIQATVNQMLQNTNQSLQSRGLANSIRYWENLGIPSDAHDSTKFYKSAMQLAGVDSNMSSKEMAKRFRDFINEGETFGTNYLADMFGLNSFKGSDQAGYWNGQFNTLTDSVGNIFDIFNPFGRKGSRR